MGEISCFKIVSVAESRFDGNPEDRFSDDEAHIICLFDLILYVPSTIFQLNRDGSSWVEPVLS